jgi:hypothetical protein
VSQQHDQQRARQRRVEAAAAATILVATHRGAEYGEQAERLRTRAGEYRRAAGLGHGGDGKVESDFLNHSRTGQRNQNRKRKVKNAATAWVGWTFSHWFIFFVLIKFSS